ncbi:MAG TPA: helix-turn-helix domain-containing protein [Verrucomicrobiae bacterium]|jgi:DNA-binding transcriptional ArsR family regulator|nr:helix-turn-helix domain-containing protein [Verrucomicrobiae bacterium]
MKPELAIRALASGKRLQVLEWLKDPVGHFPPQRDGDLVRDGVCSVFIARKLRVSQPTASEHLRILSLAGLIRGKRIKKWTFYKRNEPGITKLKKLIVTKV